MKAGPILGVVGPNWEQFRSAQVPSQLAQRSAKLCVGPNLEHLVSNGLRLALVIYIYIYIYISQYVVCS